MRQVIFAKRQGRPLALEYGMQGAVNRPYAHPLLLAAIPWQQTGERDRRSAKPHLVGRLEWGRTLKATINIARRYFDYFGIAREKPSRVNLPLSRKQLRFSAEVEDIASEGLDLFA